MKKNRKAELTTQQIVGLIILIVSFAIILFLIFRLNLGVTGDKELCHNSVVMKDQSILGSGNLNCKTSYVCISGGEECEGLTPTTTVKIDLSKDDSKQQIEKAIANEMADCWWMFGEGKADYSTGFDLGKITGNKICALCSIIVFDKKIQEDKNLKDGISQEEFYNFLQSTEKEKGKSYLYYLYRTQDAEKVKNLFKVDSQKLFNLKQQYSILTGIGEIGAVKELGNFFAGAFDDFNDIFGLKEIVGETSKFKNENIPTSFIPKSDINNFNCGEFITKA